MHLICLLVYTQMNISVIDKQVVVSVYSKKYIYLTSTLFSFLMLKKTSILTFAEIHVGIFKNLVI